MQPEIENNEAETDEPKLQTSYEDDLDTALGKAFEDHPVEGEKEKGEGSAKENEGNKELEVTTETELIPAPAEFNKREIEAWEKGDRKGIREAWDRVNHSRQQTLYQKDTEYRTYKELAQQMAPFIEASALKGKAPHVAIQEALALLNESHKDPWKVAEEIARIRGIERPKTGEPANDEINTLRNQVNQLISEREHEKTSHAEAQHTILVSNLAGIYDGLQREMHDGGVRKYPDLDNNELSVDIGSLITSAEFQRSVGRRIPNFTVPDLVLEAYRSLGGKVNEAPNQIKSLNNQEHKERARRASTSQPARSVPGNKTSQKRFKTTDEAVDAAFSDLDI